MDPISELLLEAQRRLDAETYERVETGVQKFGLRMGRKLDEAEAAWFVGSVLDKEITVSAPTPQVSLYMREWINSERKMQHSRIAWYADLAALDRSFAQVWKPRTAAADARVKSALIRVGVKCDYPISILPSELPNAFFVPSAGILLQGRGNILITAGLAEILDDEEIAAVVLHEKHHGDHWAEHMRRQRVAEREGGPTLRRVKVASVRRDIELECDAESIRQGLPADAIIGSLKKLDRRKVQLGYASSSSVRSETANHPPLDERIKHARVLEAQLQGA